MESNSHNDVTVMTDEHKGLLHGPAGLMLILAGIGVGLSGLFQAGHDHHALQNYLFALLVTFTFLASISMGALSMVIIHYVCRAKWSVSVRRIYECLAQNLWLVGLMAIPILMHLHDVFHWSHDGITDPNSDHYDHVIHHKAGYLNVEFFVYRFLIYFAILSWLSYYFYSHSLKQDEDGDLDHTRKMQKMSAIAVPLGFILISFFSFDWLMSLDPHWFSTIFGIYFFSGAYLAAHCVVAICIPILHGKGLLKGSITNEHRHDVGKWMFAFIVFWSYSAYNQFMLIKYANLPEETGWFQKRWFDDLGGFMPLSLLLLFGHFFIPFAFLLSRHIKRKAGTLTIAAVWILFVHAADLYWLAMPEKVHMQMLHGSDHAHFHVSLGDIITFLGFTLAYILIFWRRLCRNSLVPIKDPHLDFARHHHQACETV